MLKRVALLGMSITLFDAGLSQASQLDPVYLKLYGGTYSVNCSDAQADRLMVLSDRLVVASGNREMDSNGIETDLYYWGKTPPHNFEIVLTGALKPRHYIEFLIYSDKRGCTFS